MKRLNLHIEPVIPTLSVTSLSSERFHFAPSSSSKAILKPISKPFSQNQSLNQIKGLGGGLAEASRGGSHWGDCCYLPAPKAFQKRVNPKVLWCKSDPLWPANCHIRPKVHCSVHNRKCQKPLSHIRECRTMKALRQDLPGGAFRGLSFDRWWKSLAWLAQTASLI